MEGAPFGRYRLLKLLGQGGMGEVWRAHDTEIDRVVAIKMLLPHFAQDPKFEQRFRREARVAARLDDPHVVPIYDVGQIDERLYVSMKLITGQDLQALFENGPLEPQRAVGIIAQVAQALHAAHKVRLVHRDVKPSNILVAEHDFTYLIDFGIARAAGETGLTSTGTTIGTWSYMSPERFSTGVAEASSDIYALTCVLYQSLTGQLPFPAVALEQIAVAHMTNPPPRPCAQRPEIPTGMDQVIATGLAKDPAQRYPTTPDLARAARAALSASAPYPGTSAEAVRRRPVKPPADPEMRARGAVAGQGVAADAVRPHPHAAPWSRTADGSRQSAPVSRGWATPPVEPPAPPPSRGDPGSRAAAEKQDNGLAHQPSHFEYLHAAGAPSAVPPQPTHRPSRWYYRRWGAAAITVGVAIAVCGGGALIVLLNKQSSESSPAPRSSTPSVSSPAPVSSTPSTSSTSPTMSGHYIRTSTAPNSGHSSDIDWYFSPCGSGCASVATALGGNPYAQARLVNGQWTMDIGDATTVCDDGTEVRNAHTTHYTWDPYTLAGTAQIAERIATCGDTVPRSWTNSIRLRPVA